MRRARVVGVAAAVAALLWVSLDSGIVRPDRAPMAVSFSLLVLALIFGLGAFALEVGENRDRAPLFGGLAIGVGAYGVLRLVLPG